MEFTWITFFKYLGLVLTAGTAFVGSWFLEYTTTDKDTGRRKLTVWGRRAIFFAALAIITSISANVRSDYVAAKNRKYAEIQAGIDQKASNENRVRLETALGNVEKLLTAIKSTQLNPQDKETVKRAVASLGGVDDYKIYYPDLYQQIMTARSFGEFTEAIETGLERAANGRISDEKRCAIIPRMAKDSGRGFPTDGVSITKNTTLSYEINANEVTIEFSDANDLNSLGGDGYAFVFTDETESAWLNCAGFKMGMSCRDGTGQPHMKAVFNELSSKQIAQIRTSRRRYAVADAIGKRLLTIFSCISP